MKEIVEKFIWRDKDGNCYHMNDMKTCHLFFVLRMLWNHWAPEAEKIKPYKKYIFKDRYTKEYLTDAVRLMSLELSKRIDLTPYFKRSLTRMLKHLKYVEGKEISHA